MGILQFCAIVIEFHSNSRPIVSPETIKICNEVYIYIYIYIDSISVFLYLGFAYIEISLGKTSFMNIDKSRSFGACQVGHLSCLLLPMASPRHSSVYTHFGL